MKQKTCVFFHAVFFHSVACKGILSTAKVLKQSILFLPIGTKRETLPFLGFFPWVTAEETHCSLHPGYHRTSSPPLSFSPPLRDSRRPSSGCAALLQVRSPQNEMPKEFQPELGTALLFPLRTSLKREKPLFFLGPSRRKPDFSSKPTTLLVFSWEVKNFSRGPSGPGV